MTAPDGAGSTSISSGRRRPGRLAPVVGTARKMLQDALAAAGYPDRVLVACSGGPDSLALAKQIDRYNPDKTWIRTNDAWAK